MIGIEQGRIIDRQGRTINLRGVNLGGSSKMPYGFDQTAARCNFKDPNHVSFINRPFPLEEADEHFYRLKQWGLTFLRFIVTWEAIEHDGPGVYDLEYLAYLRAVVEKAGEHGFLVLIDPHQDVWSRWTGGDGAPAWTLESVGFELSRFEQTCAAVLTYGHPAPSPGMLWPVNITKLATATMFTLFFGGDDFAPKTVINGVPVQEFLQSHYINAVKKVASALRDFDFVVGYGTMNEPLKGYIAWRDLTERVIYYDHGFTPSPIQSMFLGAGIPQKVDVWKRKLFGPRRTARRIINREELRVWKEGYDCLWRANDVWDIDAHRVPRIMRTDHFTRVRGTDVDFPNHYLLPFIERFTSEIRVLVPQALIFFEGEPLGEVPDLRGRNLKGMVYAPHWYDGFTLVLKKYFSSFGVDAERRKIVVGKRRVRESYKDQLERFKRRARNELGDMPVFIGETGIAFDLDHRRAYRNGNFTKQIRAMQRSLRAAEDALLGYAIWNYTADNTNRDGDRWNGEDLSIFSRDQQIDPSDINSGGRALEAVIRPYPMATAGHPLGISFDPVSGRFTFIFRHIDSCTEPSLIFVPEFQYPGGFAVEISDGDYATDADRQMIIYSHSGTRREHTIMITRKT
ncbi:MAG: hypothetical protein A2176_07015 [Spirochaetes bacterium RBG_13_51_14]|nr:MAG: hypothetical protein A2176_07015 [Spirochaetes bacterium RBG_13_51_14]